MPEPARARAVHILRVQADDGDAHPQGAFTPCAGLVSMIDSERDDAAQQTGRAAAPAPPFTIDLPRLTVFSTLAVLPLATSLKKRLISALAEIDNAHRTKQRNDVPADPSPVSVEGAHLFWAISLAEHQAFSALWPDNLHTVRGR
jgi:hypothetical protein